MPVSIRRATLDDTDSLFPLVEAFATSFKPRRESFDYCLKHVVCDESAWLSVADRNGEIVGYCLGFDHYAFYANGRVSWVEEIAVWPESRMQGIGHALMDAFEAWAVSRGSELVGLATRRAAPFYAALGYEESATFFRKLLSRSS